MRRLPHSIISNISGVAAVEFAFALPLLLMLGLGGFELTRLLLVHQKADRVAYTITDTVAQSTSVTNSQLAQIMTAASQIMDPFTFNSEGVVIVSSIYQNGNNPPSVRWQYKGGGTLNRNSGVGAVNNTAALPGGLTLNDKDNVIIAEVYYRFAPLFGSAWFGAHDIYKEVVFKPRLGYLTTPPT